MHERRRQRVGIASPAITAARAPSRLRAVNSADTRRCRLGVVAGIGRARRSANGTSAGADASPSSAVRRCRCRVYDQHVRGRRRRASTAAGATRSRPPAVRRHLDQSASSTTTSDLPGRFVFHAEFVLAREIRVTAQRFKPAGSRCRAAGSAPRPAGCRARTAARTAPCRASRLEQRLERRSRRGGQEVAPAGAPR